MKQFVYGFMLFTVSFGCLSAFGFPRIPLVITLLSFFALIMVSLTVMQRMAPMDSLSKWIPKQEYKRTRVAFVLMLILCIVSVIFEPHLVARFKVHTPPFYRLNNNIGYTACGVFLVSFLLLPVMKMVKFNLYRKIIIQVAKQLRKWHVPISLFGLLFVFYHVYLALISGFKFNYTYVSGYAGLLDILLLSVLGLLRYKKLDRNLHKYLSYILIALLTAHTIFSELRL